MQPVRAAPVAAKAAIANAITVFFIIFIPFQKLFVIKVSFELFH